MDTTYNTGTGIEGGERDILFGGINDNPGGNVIVGKPVISATGTYLVKNTLQFLLN